MDPYSDKEPAHQCVQAFLRAQAALAEYDHWADRALGDGQLDHRLEARRRVRHLTWLLTQIEQLMEQDANARQVLARPDLEFAGMRVARKVWQRRMNQPDVQDAVSRQQLLLEPLEVLTESFYWIGARTRSVIRRLSGLEAFEAEGVRNVRNHLLEHPEGKLSGIISSSFGWGGPRGPVVKGYREADAQMVWPDQGLFLNAQQFGANLVCSVDAALRGTGSTSHSDCNDGS